MKKIEAAVAGESVAINVVESIADVDVVWLWLSRQSRIGADTETTGLDIFSPNFRLRTVQIGNRSESFVFREGHHLDAAVDMLNLFQGTIVFHNAMFDLQVLDHVSGLPLEKMYPKVRDTRILAHLIDPRGQEEGGVGQSLDALTAKLIDADVAEGVKGLMRKVAKELKTTKAKVWSIVDIDHPEFLLYAGMDPILATRLYDTLLPRVPSSAKLLVDYEHRVSEVCAVMERNGFLVDVGYANTLTTELQLEEDRARSDLLNKFEVDSPNSTEQVADALESLGVRIKARTPTGRRRVDKKLLEDLAKTDTAEGELARNVIEAKRARKWRATWVETFLKGKGADDRVHPSINPLRARTARMGITGIPAQTLPSSDWRIRRCFIPDPGDTLVSVDYRAQELRVLAALSGDSTMRRAFAAEADLHQITADAAGVDRKVGKMANFLQVYGGGPGKLAENAGIPFTTARRVTEAFRATYPGVTQFAKSVEQQAIRDGYVTTPTGRRLPVDADRAYSATNYLVQSTSRDVTCAGLLRLYDAGCGPYLRLPVHDEIITSVPHERAREASAFIQNEMRQELRGISVDTDGEVLSDGEQHSSWGFSYVPEEDRPAYNRTFSAHPETRN